MHTSNIWSLFLSFLCLASPVLSYGSSSQKPPGKNAILLSRVQSLTLRANRLTTARRVSPIPQLKCVGPSKRLCEMYTIETMRCKNEGYDYDEEDVQWTCTASLPPEFKLGSTDVVCEGYRNADDKWVLKGSCGVEYRLLLTEVGESRFGDVQEDRWFGMDSNNRWGLGDLLFFGFFIGVFGLILWSMIRDCFGLRGHPRGPNTGRGWGGFGGGGGGGGGDNGYNPGPPPPYSSYPDSSSGWRPGFWTGALGGAATGYELGRRSNRYGSRTTTRWNDRYDPGEGSSRSRSPPRFSSTTTSTGFGSTRRR